MKSILKSIRKNGFFSSHKTLETITKVDDFVCLLNLRRIFYASLFFFLFQLLRWATAIPGLPAPVLTGFITVSLLTAGTMVCIPVFYDRLKERPLLTQRLCLCFWLLAIVCMTPYFGFDVEVWKETGYIKPINVTLVCALLITLPLLSRKYIIALFAFFLAAHSVLVLRNNAGASYFIYSNTLIVAAFAVSYLVQYQYMRMIHRLKIETTIDGLTGILNRRGALEKMRTMMELSRRYQGIVAIYMIDIDYFKTYNDTFGHVQGDDVLRKVARAVSNVFSRSTDIICRYGGEEFVVCALAEGVSEPTQMAQTICDAVKALGIASPDRRVADSLTVSVGYTTFEPTKDNHHVNEIMLINRADRALYHSKATGRNRASVWTEALDPSSALKPE